MPISIRISAFTSDFTSVETLPFRSNSIAYCTNVRLLQSTSDLPDFSGKTISHAKYKKKEKLNDG